MSRITRQINIISRCQTLFRSSQLRENEICAYSNYILPICHTPGLSQEQIARRVYLDKYNVTRHLARLEQMGYVERKPNPGDRRITLVFPTEKMLALLPQMKTIINEWDSYLFDGLSEEELEQFEATLLKITNRAKAYVNSKDVIEG